MPKMTDKKSIEDAISELASLMDFRDSESDVIEPAHSEEVCPAKQIIAGEIPTPEFARFKDALAALDDFGYLETKFSSIPESEEEQMRFLAKDPEGLKIYDDINTAIGNVFGALGQLFIRALAPEPDPEKAKLVSTATNLAELYYHVSPPLAVINHKYFKNTPSLIYTGASEDEKNHRFFLLKSAVACHLVGLHEQSSTFFDQLANRVIGNQSTNTQEGREQLLKTSGKIEHFAKAASKGNQSRHEASSKTKQEAIALYQSGNFKNASQAAEKLFPKVKAIGERHGFAFASEFNGQRTLYNWLNKAGKKKHPRSEDVLSHCEDERSPSDT